MVAPIKGTKPEAYLDEEAKRVLSGLVGSDYDSDEFSVGVVGPISLKARGGSLLFVNVAVAHHVSIRTDQNCTVRFNASTKPPITVDAGVSLDQHFLEITDIYLTTTAVTTNLRIIVA
jgi:hypothetical protein